MEKAKEAATKLVEMMFTNPMSKDRTSISLVPFTLSVNVGKTYRNAEWMDLQGRSSVHWQNTDFATAAWKPESKWKLFDELGVEWAGCVEHRPGDLGTTDRPASEGDGKDSFFVPQFAPDEPGNRGASSYTWREGNQTRSRSYPQQLPRRPCRDLPGHPGPWDGRAATRRSRTRQNRLCKYRDKYRDRTQIALNGGRGPNYMCDAKPLMRLQKKAGQGALTA
jgi:hypothetical protein